MGYYVPILYPSSNPMTDNPISKKPANKLRLNRRAIREGLDQLPIERILTGSGKKRSLTTKQRDFAREVALGEPKAKAYRKVYKSKGNTNTVGSEASKLASVPKVAQEIEAFRLAFEAQEYLSNDKLKALVLHQLTLHALSEDIPPATRVRSLELLGKSNGVNLFTETKETTIIHKSSDAKASLMDKLREAMRRNSIEVDYSDAKSLLDEIKPPTPSENPDTQTHAPATPQNQPDGVSQTMHTIPLTQSLKIDDSQLIDSEEKNKMETFTDDIPHMKFEAQVVDLSTETPPVTVLNEKPKKNI